MVEEKRQFPRYQAQDLTALVKTGTADKQVALQGKIIDISFEGLKIKLDAAEAKNLNGSLLKVDLFCPNADAPVSVSCTLKYVNEEGVIGVQLVNHADNSILDDYIFECLQL